MQIKSRDYEFQIRNDDLVKVDDFLDYESHIYFQSEKSSDVWNESRKKSLLALMKTVLEEELTDRQKEIVLYVRGMRLKQNKVAEMLGLSKSTVSRHLKSAQKKFDKAYKYFELNKTRIVD